MDQRKTDTGPGNVAHFRAGSRIFRLNDAWYFSTREGEQGPFALEGEAMEELRSFLHQVGAPRDDGLFKIEYEPATRHADPKS